MLSIIIPAFLKIYSNLEAIKEDVNSDIFRKLPQAVTLLYLAWTMMAIGMNLSLDKGLAFFCPSHY